ncbi:bifunctional diguanylate cyclase/phosphodiesterase [Hydrogenimonas sp. SS33]|uniref:EAL domain-containing protein n=1 Tax=Hydrogenimonas leucolamina TaxID=2954236 RepID=UPI00336C13B5
MIKNISLRFFIIFAAFITAGVFLVYTLSNTIRLNEEANVFHNKVLVPLDRLEEHINHLYIGTLESSLGMNSGQVSERKNSLDSGKASAIFDSVSDFQQKNLGNPQLGQALDALEKEYLTFNRIRKAYLKMQHGQAFDGNKENLKNLQKLHTHYVVSYKTLLSAVRNLKQRFRTIFQNRIAEERKRLHDTFYVSMVVAGSTLLLLTFLLFEVNSINQKLKNYLEEREEIQTKLARANDELSKYSEKLEIEVKKRTAEALEHLLQNPLTKLPNRFSFIQKLGKASHASVAIFNIDRFQSYNDLFGAEVGDKIIKDYAAYLRQTIPYIYPIYHLQGDEFAVLELDRKASGTFLSVIKQAAKLAKEFHFTDSNGDFVLQISIGVAIDQRKPLIKADMALKHAKHSNESLVIYDSNLIKPHRYLENITMTKELTAALHEDRIVPYYQAIADVRSGIVVKYEALARLIDTKGNVHSPFEFIPLAKQIRLYPEITRMIFKQAMNAVETEGIHVSVNLSADDIHHQPTRDYIIDRLALSKKSDHITFELLESEETKNYEDIRLFIEKVKHFGVKIAIDDFGSGYSNFAKILKLKVDYLKIDGSFIKKIDTDEDAREFVDIIRRLASNYDIKTVAEFVSSEKIYETVKEMGIDYAQGYYISEPRPLPQILPHTADTVTDEGVADKPEEELRFDI